jgi:hypothetical protein
LAGPGYAIDPDAEDLMEVLDERRLVSELGAMSHRNEIYRS